MKISIKFLLCLLVLFSIHSCSIESDETSLDSSGLTEIKVEELLPAIQVQSARNQGGVAARMVGTIIQQFEYWNGCGATQTSWNSRLALDNYWSGALYVGALSNAKQMIVLSEESGNPFYSGVGKILMANQYGIATSIFGDIPFTEALLGEDNLFPKYDLQEDVYHGVQILLDEGIADLQNVEAQYKGGDLIYEGNISLWIKTAYALKARYYMHLSKKGISNIDQSKSFLDLAYTSDLESSYFTFSGNEGANYSLAAFAVERPYSIYMHEEFEPFMFNDPRQEKYFWLTNNELNITGNPDLVWSGQRDVKVPLISYCEIKFLEAEILTREGQDASAILAEAIQANMTMNDVEEGMAQSYISEHADLTALTQEDRMNKIMLEAHKAYFGFNFFESWTNYRRTGYPNLEEKHVTTSEYNPSGRIPVRALYTNAEMAFNTEHVLEAELRQGGAWLDDVLWAFE